MIKLSRSEFIFSRISAVVDINFAWPIGMNQTVLIVIIFSSLAVFGQGNKEYADKLKSKVVTYLSAPNKITSLNLSCLTFDKGVDADGTLNAYELHNKKCGGDPDVTLRVATFKLVSGKLNFYDDVSGELIPVP